ncbi:MAG: galactose oxidase, partial [Acidimicrobiia bacterium]
MLNGRTMSTRRGRMIGLVVVAVAMTGCGVGKWEIAPTAAPVRAVHAALLKNGHVLLIQGSGNDPDLFAAGTFSTTEWDPVANTFRSIPTPYDMFCSGHAALPDGSLLVAGGTAAYPDQAGNLDYKGSNHAYKFDIATHRYVQVPDLAEGHWYPTLVNRGDGTVVLVGGTDQNAILQSHMQTFDSTGNRGAGTWTPQVTTASFFPPYPALHLMQDGRFLYSGVSTFGDGSDDAGIWNPIANTFNSVAGLPDRYRRDMGASV